MDAVGLHQRIKTFEAVRAGTHPDKSLTLSAVTDELLDAYEHELAVLRSRHHHAERMYKKWYEKNRLLENRVRAIGQMLAYREMHHAILMIAKRLPNKPRPKFGEKRPRR